MALSAREERKIRERIAESLSFAAAADTAVIEFPCDEKSRTEKLREDFRASALPSKVKFWAGHLFVRRGDDEVLLAAKLRDLRKIIRKHPVPLTDFTARSFSPGLAGAFWGLYRAAVPLKAAIDEAAGGPEAVEAVAGRYLADRVPGLKTGISDLVDADEMKNLFLQTESRENLLSLVESRLNSYGECLRDAGLEACAADIMPLYYIRNLANFPFEEFFGLFGCSCDGGENEEPDFRGAEIYPALRYVEWLYCLLHPLRRYGDSGPIRPGLRKALAEAFSDGTLRRPGFRDGSDEAEELENRSRELAAEARAVGAGLPLAELIRYYHDDPYYKLLVYRPKLRLAEFYADSLRLRVLRSFDDFFLRLRRSILADMMKELFADGEPPGFEFFMNAGLGLLPRPGLPGFTHTKSLAVLYDVIRLRYRGIVRGVIAKLVRSVSGRRRETLGLLQIHAAGCEETEARLKAYDFSFSPESQDGKTFLRLKFAVEKQFSQQKFYRIFVARKDDEGNELFRTGLFHLEGLLSGLSDLVEDGAFLDAAARRAAGTADQIRACARLLSTARKALRILSMLEAERP